MAVCYSNSCRKNKCMPSNPGVYPRCGAADASGRAEPSGKKFFWINGTICSSRVDIPAGAVIPFDLISGKGNDIAYSRETGLFNIRRAGLYFFSWGFTATPVSDTKVIQINLEQVPSPFIFSGIATKASAVAINGSSFALEAAIGESYGFINRSEGPIDLIDLGPGFYNGKATIFRIA